MLVSQILKAKGDLVFTVTPGASARIFAAACSSTSAPRAVMVTFTPSFASATAQPSPSPLLAAQTSALRPLMPKSMTRSPDDRTN